MGSLVRNISGLASAGYGVNVWEKTPVSGVRGQSSNAIGMVAELPWGDVDVVTFIGSAAEFWATFYPNVFGAGAKDYTTYPAVLAMLNKPIFPAGGLYVVRVGATGQVKATRAAIVAGTGTLSITAKYFGAIGNGISTQFVAATDADPAHRNLIITIGSDYTATYQNLAFATVTSVVDPYVVVTGASPSAMPAADVAAVALAAGANGTAIAADYVGSTSSDKGIRLFYGEGTKIDVLFVAECPSALIAAVNTGMLGWAGEDKGFAILSTPAAQAKATALTYVATYRDDHCVYTYPRVKTTNWWASDAAEVTVDGNAFAAALIANVDPWISPGGAGKLQGSTNLLSGITGLEVESLSTSDMDACNAAGIAPWYMSTKLGAIMRKAVTTSLTGRSKIRDRRYTDYLIASVADFSEQFVERPLDVDLTNQNLGEWAGTYVSEIKAFLAVEAADFRIKGSSVDPFSLNSTIGVNAGQWLVGISVQTRSDMDEIVLVANIGDSVTVTAVE
jgi:hypothetical protein